MAGPGHGQRPLHQAYGGAPAAAGGIAAGSVGSADASAPWCTGARAVLHSHQSCGRTALLVCPQDADSVWCCHAQYLILANGARGRAAVALIQQAISNPHLFHFGELIDHENIAALDGARLPFSRSCGRACAPEVQKSCFARFCASQKARRLGQGDVAPKQAVARL